MANGLSIQSKTKRWYIYKGIQEKNVKIILTNTL